jgi:hypothetical protein
MYGQSDLYYPQAMQPLVGNAKNCYHYNGNRGDIVFARDHSSGTTSASQYPRYKGQYGELTNLREGYYVPDTDHSGPSYNYSSFCYGFAFFIQERKAHYTELNQRVFQPLTFLQPPNIDTHDHRNFFETSISGSIHMRSSEFYPLSQSTNAYEERCSRITEFDNLVF